jgi:hypothetical protein
MVGACALLVNCLRRCRHGLYNEELSVLPGSADFDDVTPTLSREPTPQTGAMEGTSSHSSHPRISLQQIDAALAGLDDPVTTSIHGSAHGGNPGNLSVGHTSAHGVSLGAPTPKAGPQSGHHKKGFSSASRKSIGSRAVAAEVILDAEKTVENLKTAFETKMEMAIIGVLQTMAQSIAGSADKQKAFHAADAHTTIIAILNEMSDKPVICEKSLIVTSLLCRHNDELKSSVCLDNVKSFGSSGAIEAIYALIQKHGNDHKVMEATCDAVRCLSYMEHNRMIMGSIGLCESIGRALSMVKFLQSTETCPWICRAVGHMCINNDANKERFGTVGACESAVAVLQQHQTNANICTEACWAIRNLAPVANNRSRFADEFGPESVISVMKQFKANELLMTEGCKALVACIEDEDDQEMIERIGNSGCIQYVLKSVKRNPSSDTLARWAFNLLYFVCTDLKFWPSLSQNDILDTLSSTLQEHASVEGVAEWGCRIVHELAPVEGVYGRMRTAGLCEMVVSCVQRQAMSASVSGYGCLAIGDLATDRQNHSRLSQSGACEAVVGALKRHDYDANVVFQTCHAIHFLTTTENNVSWMGANGGCEAIVAALVKHTATSLPATRYALKAVGSLGLHDEGNLMRFHHSNACSAVVNALRTYINDELVAEQACRAVYYLCTEPPNVNELGKAGAAKLVVQVLQSLSHNPDVVKNSCLAIFGLAVKTKIDKVHVGNTKKLVSIGAIESVVAAVFKSPEDPELVRAGCMAIASLARLDENRIKLGEVGAVQVILNGYASHPNEERVVCQLAFATEAMCNNNEVNKTKFASAGIVDTLLSCLAKHERNKHVVGETFRALVTLSSHEGCKMKIRSDAAVKLCVKALRIHEKEMKVAKWGCTWVHAIATDDVARERLGLAKASEAVISVLAKHSVASIDVLVWGCKSLIGLSVLDANLFKFCNTETCAAIVAGLKAHHEDMNAAEWACSAIVKLAHNDQNKTRIGTAGGCSAISMSLQKLAPVSVAVVRLACEAIYFLAQDDTNRQLFGTAGACEVLSTCLSLHLTKSDVADRICKAISAVAKASPIPNDNAGRLGSSGACELLSALIKAHSFAPLVCEWGCAAIAALATNNSRNQVAFCLPNESLGSGSICGLLVDVIRSHSSAAVIANATRAVRALSKNNHEIIEKFAYNGVIQNVLRALKAHKVGKCLDLYSLVWFVLTVDIQDDSAVIEHVSWILANIVAPDVEPLTLSTTPGLEEESSESGPASRSKYHLPNSKELYRSAVYWDLLLSILASHYNSAPLSKWICAAIR